MIYAPHTLYKKKVGKIHLDSLGKPIAPTEEWVLIGPCRCDDDTTQELVSENGKVYKSRYHVVYDFNAEVTEGDEIRCTDGNGCVRGAGLVGRVKHTNYLRFSELWT